MKTTTQSKSKLVETAPKFADTGRLKESRKRSCPKAGKAIPVYIVVGSDGKVIRVTGDPVDARTYRDAFATSKRWGKVSIVERSVTL